MKLNMENYFEDLQLDNEEIKKEKKIIDKYIDQFEEESYDDKISYELDDNDTIYTLSSIRHNLLNWYNFKPNSNILEVGAGLGSITSLLCKKCASVTSLEFLKYRGEAIAKRCQNFDNLEVIVSKINEFTTDQKFDYISLIGVFEKAGAHFQSDTPHKDLILFFKRFLKDDGTIILSFNNKFGIKYFAGEIIAEKKFPFEGIEGKTTNNMLCRKDFDRMLETISGFNVKYYYPLPDMILPDIIFSDDYLPTKNLITKYFKNYITDKYSFDEQKVLAEIVKSDKDLFKNLTNSYLIELNPKQCITNPKMISFNNHRRKKYRLVTKIYENYVEKEAISQTSIQHIENIAKNIEVVKSYGLNILDRVEDNKLFSKYISNAITLEDTFSDNNMKNTEICIEKFKNVFMKYAQEHNTFVGENIFNKYFSNQYKEFDLKENNEYINNFNFSICSNFHFLEHGIFDAIAQNCFIINDEWFFFDQEWMEQNVPIEFIIYRMIFYSNNINQDNKNYLYEKFGISSYVELFSILERRIQLSLLDMKLALFLNKKTIRYSDFEKEFQVKNFEYMEKIDNLKEEMTSKEQHVKNLESIIATLKENNEISERNYEQTHEKLEAVLNSTSWKITKPLRYLKRSVSKNDKE